MAFDVEGAKAAGYSDAEIADHLAGATKFDTAGARKAGYTDAELIAHLSGTPAAAPETPSVDEYGRTMTPITQAAAAAPLPTVAVGGKEPGYVQSETLPLARQQSVIDDPNSHWWQGWAVAPGPLRALGQSPGENVTINPATNTMNIAPEALGAAMTLGGVGALRRGPTPAVPAGLAAREAPLTPAFQENAFTPMATARVAETPPGAPVTVPGPTTPNAFAPAASTEAAPVSATGIPRTAPPPTPPAASTEGAPASATSAAPTTSDAARSVATDYYRTFDKAAQDGGSMAPAATNKFIASVEAAAPTPGIGQAVAGKNVITDLVERLQPYKDKPMTLQDVQDIDRQMGSLITENFRTNPDMARQLQDLQHGFRDQTSNPAPGDVVGGQAGLDALAPARKAYQQSMKMETLERIQQRANDTDNPTTSVRTQVRTLLNNDRMSRGWTDEEKAALRSAADRGAIDAALHMVGSRLVPYVAAGVGSSGGFFGTVASAATAHWLGGVARNVQNTRAASRMDNAMAVLGRSVPPRPIAPNKLFP